MKDQIRLKRIKGAYVIILKEFETTIQPSHKYLIKYILCDNIVRLCPGIRHDDVSEFLDF